MSTRITRQTPKGLETPREFRKRSREEKLKNLQANLC